MAGAGLARKPNFCVVTHKIKGASRRHIRHADQSFTHQHRSTSRSSPAGTHPNEGADAHQSRSEEVFGHLGNVEGDAHARLSLLQHLFAWFDRRGLAARAEPNELAILLHFLKAFER